MTTHDGLLSLVTGDPGPVDPRPAEVPAGHGGHRLGAPGVLSGEELMATALAGLADADPEDHLVRLARREALLHRLALDRQRRRRRSA